MKPSSTRTASRSPKASNTPRTSPESPKSSGASDGLDFMVVAAHPDDAELFAGGTVLALRALGRRGMLVDVTDGAAGTRGSAALRARESAAAAARLGVERACLGGPDGRVRNTLEAQAKLIALLRRHRPKVVFTHHPSEEHPDHGTTAALVKEAAFRAGLVRFEVPGGDAPFRPGRIFYAVHSATSVVPTFCVDITAHWEEKLRVLRCYESQFHVPGASRYKGKTDLATPAFLDALEVRARWFGQRIRRRHAEAFWCEELAEVADPVALGLERFP